MIQGRYQKLRPILAQYSQSGNEDLAYQALVLNSHWGQVYVMRKSKKQLDALQEHVRGGNWRFYIKFFSLLVYEIFENVRQRLWI